MKKLLSICYLMLLINYTASSQQTSKFPTEGMSPSTAFLLADLMVKEQNPQAFSEDYFVKKYSVIRKDDKLYVNSFIKVTNDFELSRLGNFGVLLGSKSGNISTALVPVNQIMNIVKTKGVLHLAIGEPVTLMMDSARKSSNVDKVHQGLQPLTMPYKGDGVVVGDIDLGFDYTHPNFYDSTGTNNYRIKRVWEQYNATGTPPAGYSYGTEYTTQAAILNAKTDFVAFSHGSHVMGIAAGSGGYPNSPYVGVAPHADIVMVGGDIETDVKVADAISYIQAYASSVGKPSVINMSFGNNKGPKDGNSTFDQYIANLIGPGKLLVSAAGNDGDVPDYLGHNFTATDTLIHTLVLFGQSQTGDNEESGYLCIWGAPTQNFTASLSIINAATNIREDSTAVFSGNVNSVIYDTLYGTNNIPITVKMSSGIQTQLSNQPEILLEVDNTLNTLGTYFLILTIKGQNTNIKMWGQEQARIYFSNGGVPPPFYGGTTDHTVSDGGGTSNSTICVGAYTTKNKWTTINNIPVNDSAWYPLHDIAPFSAHGPTADGRTKPDITAPGAMIISSFNSYDTTNDINDAVDQISSGGHTWYFYKDQGTSMAAPMVTGILALWLQKNPMLTTAQALTLLKNTAITDTFTGVIPPTGDNTWGWGKVNAFAGLISLDVEDVTYNTSLKAYPNPATSEVNISFEKAAPATNIVMCDMSGKIVFQKQLSLVESGQVERINMIPFPYGTYVVKVASEKAGQAHFKIIKK
jgi:subtilisin family serine protease